MSSSPFLRRVVALASTLTLAAGLGASTAQAAPTATSDAVRTDRVQTALAWQDCSPALPPGFEGLPPIEGLQCATVALPLDYDDPTGPQVDVWVVKHAATDPDQRIGSLFVNPGGPGGSGALMAQLAELAYSPELVAKFDIIGMDPRGTNGSTNVVCGTSTKKQLQEWRGFATAIPLTRSEQAAYLNSSKQEAMGCSKTGKPLSASMSTAEVARDMDVLRRLVGDEKLSYAGVSYGTYLGQVYANMYPDRVRALVIDGVLDPLAWAGTKATADEPVTLRIESAEGAHKALQEIFELCSAAGPEFCLNAPDPQAKFDTVVSRLKAKPLVITDPESGLSTTLDYGAFVGNVLQVMYAPSAPELVDFVVFAFDQMTDPATTPTQAFKSKAAVDQKVKKAKEKVRPQTMEGYNQGLDAFISVLCTDSLNPVQPKAWPPAIAARAENAPHFAEAWGWQSATCANRFWKAVDEDAWRGPFDTKTSAPVLVVGNYYDPATNYSGAVAASQLLPNSRLLSVDSFGHGAHGSNACATAYVDDYLLTGALPPAGTVCSADYVPFSSPLG